MQDQITHFEIDNITYPMAFTLNVLEEIQKKYGSYEEWGKLTDGKENEPNIEALKFAVREMINEGIDIENENSETKREFLSSKQVGRLVTKLGTNKMANELKDLVISSTKVEEESKNV